MLLKLIVILIAVFAHESKGVPLESPTDKLENFFAPRIIGGTEADKNDAPHMVGIVIGHDFAMVICGASLVTPSHVVTAAHCITIYVDSYGTMIETYHGVVGSNNWNSGGLSVDFKEFHVHPNWDLPTIKNDIGVLTIKNRLTLTKDINIIPLGVNHVDGLERSYVTGWGYTKVGMITLIPYNLQILNVTIISSVDCAHRMKEAAALGWIIPDIDPALEICTLHSVNHGNCYGDSGGPLVSWETNELLGIVSWAIPCAVGAPDVYTRISAFIEFINNAINK